MNKYIVIKNFMPENSGIKNSINDLSDKFQDSKVGDGVNDKKKIRKDFALRVAECKVIDLVIFEKIKPLLEWKFGVSISYRERYKIGWYSGEKLGFYVPHTDKQGGMDYRDISMVVCASRQEDYDGGEFLFPDLDISFKLDLGDAIFFDSSMRHGVKPVTRGNRYVLISFLFGELGAKLKRRKVGSLKSYSPTFKDDLMEGKLDNLAESERLLFCITPESGPGNQILSIKESLIAGKILNRKLILPPINQHYTLNKSVYWKFFEIYSAPQLVAIEYDPKLMGGVEKCHLLHANYQKESRLEVKLNLKIESVLLEKRKFRNAQDFSALQLDDTPVLVLKHVFDNVLLTNLPINGAVGALENPDFAPLYHDICSKIDYAAHIMRAAMEFISNNKLEKFISIHMRYPDVMGANQLKDFIDYSEEDVLTYLNLVCHELGIPVNRIFVATNNQKKARQSALKECTFFEYAGNQEYNTFIEQCICSESDAFVMSRFNDYSKTDDKYTRSSWSSFVKDHRLYLKKKPANSNLVLFDPLISPRQRTQGTRTEGGFTGHKL